VRIDDKGNLQDRQSFQEFLLVLAALPAEKILEIGKEGRSQDGPAGFNLTIQNPERISLQTFLTA
jgi:hypothetical protein